MDSEVGKEFDTQAGLNLYDYHARQYEPAIGRFTSIDPHAENYYSISPYAYCLNNPVRYTDPDGKDAKLTGEGTLANPFVITANYYYDKSNLNSYEIDALHAAINAYNNGGSPREVKMGKSKVYVLMKLKVEGADDENAKKLASNDTFVAQNGNSYLYGNYVGREAGSDKSNEFGSANGKRIDLNRANVESRNYRGMNDGEAEKKAVMVASFIHEIGHNLGLDHRDKDTDIMNNVTTDLSANGYHSLNSGAKVDNDGIGKMVERKDKPRAADYIGVIMSEILP